MGPVRYWQCAVSKLTGVVCGEALEKRGSPGVERRRGGGLRSSRESDGWSCRRLHHAAVVVGCTAGAAAGAAGAEIAPEVEVDVVGAQHWCCGDDVGKSR